jgi:hypothetical protein
LSKENVNPWPRDAQSRLAQLVGRISRRGADVEVLIGTTAT